MYTTFWLYGQFLIDATDRLWWINPRDDDEFCEAEIIFDTILVSHVDKLS